MSFRRRERSLDGVAIGMVRPLGCVIAFLGEAFLVATPGGLSMEQEDGACCRAWRGLEDLPERPRRSGERNSITSRHSPPPPNTLPMVEYAQNVLLFYPSCSFSCCYSLTGLSFVPRHAQASGQGAESRRRVSPSPGRHIRDEFPDDIFIYSTRHYWAFAIHFNIVLSKLE